MIQVGMGYGALAEIFFHFIHSQPMKLSHVRDYPRILLPFGGLLTDLSPLRYARHSQMILRMKHHTSNDWKPQHEGTKSSLTCDQDGFSCTQSFLRSAYGFGHES